MLRVMAANEGVAVPRARARRQGVVTGAVGMIGMSLGTLIVSVLLGGFSWSSLQTLVPQVDTLVWALIVAFALPFVGAADLRFAIAAVALGLVVAVVSAVAQFGGMGDILFVVSG